MQFVTDGAFYRQESSEVCVCFYTVVIVINVMCFEMYLIGATCGIYNSAMSPSRNLGSAVQFMF